MSLLEGLATNAAWDGVKTFGRFFTGRQIQITSPGPKETLSHPEVSGLILAYSVHGRFKHLPKGHEIWLLVENEKSKLFWPQGFNSVIPNFQQQTWSGKVTPNIARSKEVKIVAVVAPPTSQLLFRYYEKNGSKTDWDPLPSIPDECKSMASVQVIVP